MGMTFSDFGRTIANAAKEGVRGGLIEGFLNGTGNSAATGKINYAETRYEDNIANGQNSSYNAVLDVENRFKSIFGTKNYNRINPLGVHKYEGYTGATTQMDNLRLGGELDDELSGGLTMN